MARRSNRKHSKIDGLAPELKATVEQMLLSDATYAEIVDFLEDNGVSVSIASVCRYAQDYDANIQALAIAQENFRAMMEELERYPDLDTTEAIIRLTSQNMFKALANTTEEDWQGIKVDKMMKEARCSPGSGIHTPETGCILSGPSCRFYGSAGSPWEHRPEPSYRSGNWPPPPLYRFSPAAHTT